MCFVLILNFESTAVKHPFFTWQMIVTDWSLTYIWQLVISSHGSCELYKPQHVNPKHKLNILLSHQYSTAYSFETCCINAIAWITIFSNTVGALAISYWLIQPTEAKSWKTLLELNSQSTRWSLWDCLFSNLPRIESQLFCLIYWMMNIKLHITLFYHPIDECLKTQILESLALLFYKYRWPHSVQPSYFYAVNMGFCTCWGYICKLCMLYQKLLKTVHCELSLLQ